jgi:hypothetical protein
MKVKDEILGYVLLNVAAKKTSGRVFQRLSVNSAVYGDPVLGDQLDLFSLGSIPPLFQNLPRWYWSCLPCGCWDGIGEIVS